MADCGFVWRVPEPRPASGGLTLALLAVHVFPLAAFLVFLTIFVHHAHHHPFTYHPKDPGKQKRSDDKIYQAQKEHSDPVIGGACGVRILRPDRRRGCQEPG